MKSKPVQVAIIVIGLLIGAVGIALAIKKSGAPQTASSVLLVDMKSGELFRASTKGRTLVLPAKNPDTGERTLIRVEHDEASTSYRIDPRYFDTITEIQGDLIKVDPETGKVEVDLETKPKSIG